MAWRPLTDYERELLGKVTPQLVVHLADAKDRGFITSLVRLADNPRLTVSETDAARLVALVLPLIEAPVPAPTQPAPSGRPAPKPHLPLPTPAPRPIPAPPVRPSPPRLPPVLVLTEPPDGTDPGMIAEYVDGMRAMHGARNSREMLEFSRKLVGHRARRLFFQQKLDSRTVAALIPLRWTGEWSDWAVCPIGLTDHFLQRWRERSGLPLSKVLLSVAAPFTVDPVHLRGIRLDWRLVGSLVVQPDEYPGLRIGDQPPDLALRNARGIVLLRSTWQSKRFTGFTAVTYVPLPERRVGRALAHDEGSFLRATVADELDRLFRESQ